MQNHAKVVAYLAILAYLAGCGHGGLAPTPPSPALNSETRSNGSTQSAVTTGNFTEFSLPAGVNPSDLTRGPYDTVYFKSNSGGPATIYEMLATTGHVYAFTAPSPYQGTGFDAIVSYNRSVTFVVFIPINENEFFLAHITPEHTFSFEGAAYLEYGIMTNLALGPDGNPWYGYCIDPCLGGQDGSVVPPGTRLDDADVPSAITPGPGGYMYVTTNVAGPFPPASRVYVLSTSGAILRTVDFPAGSNLQGIATGSDHNLWITEPGINKIARMTPTGSVTQFALPTANAGPDRIVGSYDSALFFTEKTANKIGRITTNGFITEYKIPTANSGPTGITPCSSVNCGTHGGVWFTETTANKIAKFNAPI